MTFQNKSRQFSNRLTIIALNTNDKTGVFWKKKKQSDRDYSHLRIYLMWVARFDLPRTTPTPSWPSLDSCQTRAKSGRLGRLSTQSQIWVKNQLNSVLDHREKGRERERELRTSLPWIHYYCSVVEEEAERIEEHKQEDIVGDIPAGDIPEADKRLWDIAQVDNLIRNQKIHWWSTLQYGSENFQAAESDWWLRTLRRRNTNWGLLLVVIAHGSWGCWSMVVGWNIIKSFASGRRETGCVNVGEGIPWSF